MWKINGNPFPLCVVNIDAESSLGYGYQIGSISFQMQIEQSKLINKFCIEFEWTNVKYKTKLLCLILMDFECSFD